VNELNLALASGRKQNRTAVVVIETSYDQRVPGYESWWDVPIAEVSERDAVKAARRNYEEARGKERWFF
jgi:3D-(3,5/4)-trihydroxycyclohexane-1,2-dione acylhydrolase (decyclizing)